MWGGISLETIRAVGLICGACGHEGDMDTFTIDSFGHQLPPSQWQCPQCGIAVERKVNKNPKPFEQSVQVVVIGQHFLRMEN